MKCFYPKGINISQLVHPECELFEITSGNDFPWDVIEKAESVYVIGLSWNEYKSKIKYGYAHQLVWVDSTACEDER